MGKFVETGGAVFRGRVGAMVGYMWKGQPCLRTYRREIAYPNTVSQQEQRSWFVSMVRFAGQATEALRLGVRQAAERSQMTEGNYFVKSNKEHFKRTAEGVEVNYKNLHLSEGSAADVVFHDARFEAGEVVVVDFDKGAFQLRASGEDRVYLYIYAEGMGKGYLSAPVARRNKQLKIKLPEEWAGEVVHLYGFVVDREGRASKSTYIGIGKVNHYEERGKYVPVNHSWQEFVDMATRSYSSPGEMAKPINEEPRAKEVEGRGVP